MSPLAQRARGRPFTRSSLLLILDLRGVRLGHAPCPCSPGPADLSILRIRVLRIDSDVFLCRMAVIPYSFAPSTDIWVSSRKTASRGSTCSRSQVNA